QPWQLGDTDRVGPGGMLGGAATQHSEFNFHWTAGKPSQQVRNGMLGRAVLTPQTGEAFAARLDKYLHDHEDDPNRHLELWALAEARDCLSRSDLLSQTLTGFNLGMVQRSPSAFPVPDLSPRGPALPAP